MKLSHAWENQSAICVINNSEAFVVVDDKGLHKLVEPTNGPVKHFRPFQFTDDQSDGFQPSVVFHSLRKSLLLFIFFITRIIYGSALQHLLEYWDSDMLLYNVYDLSKTEVVLCNGSNKSSGCMTDVLANGDVIYAYSNAESHFFYLVIYFFGLLLGENLRTFEM